MKNTHQFKNNFILHKGLTIHTLRNKHVFTKNKNRVIKNKVVLANILTLKKYVFLLKKMDPIIDEIFVFNLKGQP